MIRMTFLTKVLFLMFVLMGGGSCVCNCSHNGGNLRAQLQKDVTLEQEMAAGGSFSIDTRHGDITVRGGQTKKCVVRARVKIRAVDNEKAQQVAEDLELAFENSGSATAVVSSLLGSYSDHSVYIDYDVTVPEQTELLLNTTHGKIECVNIKGCVSANTTHDPILCSNIIGDLKLTTTHDPVRLKNIIGKIEAATSHDPIEVNSCAGPMNLRTTHDRVTCRDILCKQLNVRTSHDNVEVAYSKETSGAVEANIVTTHGNITFDLPDGYAGEVGMSTTHGRVHTDVPIMVKGAVSEGRMSGSVGQGQGKVSLATTHGNVYLR